MIEETFITLHDAIAERLPAKREEKCFFNIFFFPVIDDNFIAAVYRQPG